MLDEDIFGKSWLLKDVSYPYKGKCIVFSGAEPVYVSQALQKSKIIVNEDGTKAASVTGKYLYSEPTLSWT